MSGEQFTKNNEGLRLSPYLCPAGKITVGYGHNLEAHPITKEQADAFFEEDYDRAVDDVIDFIGDSFNAVVTDDVRHAALVDMSFQMGGGGLSKFRNMRAAILRGDWHTAAKEALDSRYATQTPKRALKVAHMLRTGTWYDED